MTLLLISNSAIINQIFSLVCSKLNIELEIIDHTDVKSHYDFIVVDENLIDDQFNFIKQFSTRLGAIVAEELPFDKSRDFIIPRPFLPTQLQIAIADEIESIEQEKKEAEKPVVEERDEDTDEEVFAYVESLANDTVHEIDEESDESIVTLASLRDGGVLDTGELSKINTLLDESLVEKEDVFMDEDDWKDLSEIIDEALHEVQDYEFSLSDDGDVINVVLNRYSIDELKPLLRKFDQSVIDKLANGESIDLRLSVKAES